MAGHDWLFKFVTEICTICCNFCCTNPNNLAHYLNPGNSDTINNNRRRTDAETISMTEVRSVGFRIFSVICFAEWRPLLKKKELGNTQLLSVVSIYPKFVQSNWMTCSESSKLVALKTNHSLKNPFANHQNTTCWFCFFLCMNDPLVQFITFGVNSLVSTLVITDHIMSFIIHSVSMFCC